ncbi:cob(I)yrinic acid a,c-diamide adenosyltransferase [Iocasia frigidifontis]|uniref:Cob(I)yrinic acid a,c-diamide adenosyltransferase n=1 Tax=Iocasia fonsfrigidae TaxID=2682810 RepID=A0A8A7KC26_9FIRM|nr:cob(I)yrinic acid a,c-diamide adenosyltransferase [Iocasia fonsfrigidae]QTL98790.1 cob(I)yrinic acid a,c-diamide adenosyltransferase [Iocasia fonsfrigidae]
MKGKIHVYTGNGKGKTTAAIGLTIRAVGAGFKVFFGQFVKGEEYSEIKALKKLDNVVVKQYGRDCFIRNEPAEEDIMVARQGLAEMSDILQSGDYQLVVMDEANIAVYYKLFSLEELIEVLQNRADGVEVVITGRMAEEGLIKIADLVTSMEEVKHYYQQGIQARIGIEK